MFFKIAKALVKFVCKLWFRVTLTGEENIPREGGCMLCLNHTSLWDPPLVTALLKRRVYFIAKEELFGHFFVGWVLRSIGTIPVKRGQADLGAIKTSIRALREGKMLGIFPAGRRTRPGQKVKIKSGVALIATRSGVPVVPVYINGTFKPFSKLSITIGEPVDMSVYEGQKLAAEELDALSNDIYNRVMALSGVEKA
ncbi:MAG: 1-acyl-sn-glycerol-3-phosphate acyltransferase [Ruminococcaceae bacterium]|nr:1-acyl-sn-glycerol-3-phosphate acyltransferase [Oscillospiraceae bacterium]